MGRSAGKVFRKRKARNCGKKQSECVSDPNVLPSTSEHSCADAAELSAREKKLPDLDTTYKNIPEPHDVGYRNILMDLNTLASVFHEAVRCIQCKSKGVTLVLDQANTGLASKLELKCLECGFSYEFHNSERHGATETKPGMFVINTRLVYAMRSIGKGAEAARLFCGLMNLPQPPSKFSDYNKMLLEAAKDVCEATMCESVNEAKVINGCTDISVAVDGTWQKRGFSSLNGVVTATSVDTGKVIDVQILSKHCLCPDKKKHLDTCKKNFDGYSGKMEVDGALAMFRRSESQYDARYVNYLGDGDSKAFTVIEKENIYGDECPVQKLECIGHVMKRMGSRLRRLKVKMRGQKLSDGKSLSGRNRLTNAEIDKLQTYYSLAIRRNLVSVSNMRQAVWAIFLHKVSTDQKPQHGFCPPGKDSWCGFQRAEASNETYHHQHSLPEAVVEAMRPIFKDLSNPDLLQKCLHGNTQNPNESVNNVIWSRVPKSTFVHIQTLSLGVYDAVASFNAGNSIKLKILQKLGINLGDYAITAMKVLDKERISKAKYANALQTKDARKKKRLKRKREDDEAQEKVDESGYGGGSF